MLDANQWLDEVLPSGQTRAERLCFLVYANGGFGVSGWGVISYGAGHQRGLEQDDAMALMELSAYMMGATDAGVDLFAAFRPRFDRYAQQLKSHAPSAVG